MVSYSVNKRARKTKKTPTGKVVKITNPQSPAARAPELKHYDYLAFTTPSNTGTLTLLSSITSQGAQDNQRIGDSVFITKLEMRYGVIRNANQSCQMTRLILVQDKMGYNTPSITDILEPGPFTFQYAPHAQYNHYFMSRFRILSDWIVRTTSSSDSANATGVKKLKVNSKVEYVGAATFKNQIYLLAVSDESNVLALPQVNYMCRFYYTDL